MTVGGLTRAFVALFTSSVLVFGMNPGVANSAAFDPDRISKNRGDVTLQIGELGTARNHSVLQIQPPAPDENLQRAEWRWCQSLEDPTCDFSDPSLDIIGTMILPYCESAAAENCVESLRITNGSTSAVADFVRDAEAGIKWPAEPSRNFFEAGSPLLFSVPGIPNGGNTNQYAVIATAATKFDHPTQKFFTRNLSVAVVPYSEERDPDYKVETIGSGANNSCVFVEEGVCGVREDFSAGAVVSVSVRAPAEISGWFMGRIKDPTVEIESLSRTNNRISVSAQYATVTRFALSRSPESLTLNDRKAMGNSGSSGSYNGTTIGTAANDQSAFGVLKYFRDEVRDTAAGVNTLWNIGTIQAPPSGCLADKSKVLGVVATNAMVYDGGTPRYENGYLNYKVGGLHFMPNGKDLVIGTYDLVMRSETARCLYGFSKAPISATVAVVGNSGEEKVATTVVSEKDGWLKLAAYGFTFSEKEVRVTLSQPQKLTLARFPAKSAKLGSQQKAQLKNFADGSKGLTTVTCSANYFLSQSKKLAETRAQATCAEVRKQLSNVKILVKSQRIFTRALDGVVSLTSK